MTPAISVLMPVRDGTWLGPALDSLLAQSFRDFELVIVEDGADPAARAAIEARRRADPRR